MLAVGHMGMTRAEEKTTSVSSCLLFRGPSFEDPLSRIHDKRPMGRPAESHLSLSHMDMKIGALPDQLMFTAHTDLCPLHSLWIPAATLLPTYSTRRYVFLDFQMELRWRRPFLKVPVAPCIYDMSTALNGVPKHSRHHDHVDFFGSRIKSSQTYMKHLCGTTGSRLKLHMYKSAVDIC